MPISAENDAKYPGVAFADILPGLAGASAMVEAAIGHKPHHEPGFWESVVATYLAATRTRHNCPHDLELAIWGKPCRVEVKFSRAYLAKFATGSRHVLKWAKVSGTRGSKDADATVLIGLDVDERVYAWVFPRGCQPSGSCTITAPSARAGWASDSDAYMVSFHDLLPAVAHAAHNAAITRAEKRGQPDLYGKR